MRFHTVLIANRGEIALRVMKTARRLGLRTVAVYSDADRDALHVREADMAVHIGPADSSLSYRNIPAILMACARSGAQAVHPGYGFLSENAEFAQAVVDAGLTFIGPSSRVIALMGNKAQAKTAMQAAGVPTIPGAQDCTVDEDVVAAVRRIGYPVIFKAAAGGGGRGMRVAREEASLLKSFHEAQSEALGAFGSDEIIIERAIERARHIEIQVLCDEHGHHLHLGERDCSMQRRFQKIIEEAPSPAVSPALRDAMGAVARQACAAIDYVGVGTLEFLLDPDGSFYFMEMNTRLQVEHGVTELVTGLDLVEQQIRVAQGEPLAFEQQDVTLRGHAIELRVCAEDPDAGFVPQVGRVDTWCASPDIRVDTALESPMVVSPYYDSMVAKFLTWAPSREECIQKLSLACEKTVLLGIKTNLSFLERCINHPVFLRGEATTTFLSREDLRGVHWQRTPSLHAAVGGALAISGVFDTLRTNEVRGAAQRPAFELLVARQGDGGTAVLPQDGDPVRVRVRPVIDGFMVSMGSASDESAALQEISVTDLRLESGRIAFAVDGLRRSLTVSQPDLQTVWIQDGASAWCYQRAVRQASLTSATAGMLQIRAPMTGRVISLLLQLGDEVTAQQTLAVVESMKMEMPITATVGGTVSKLNTSAGEQIATGQILMEITRA
ncbi:acetyl-CoA carboxylase biotin carboxylase subunit [Polaromonas sp. AER18D-145]|uniref:acetyl/propionyl/methylcrotonyl-CoA carboxylase subunit alpha n=1 Tax=Polaromonas sp. AER18D-145 TaxID=1977060 RepID=UPI000BBC59E6|nr:acetyl-CoA carboxylase biotin carboxylase subunit [Polaromonas sp. AER18D-145]